MKTKVMICAVIGLIAALAAAAAFLYKKSAAKEETLSTEGL